MSLAFGLHKLPTQELTRLLRALHRGSLPSPLTRASLITASFGDLEAHLDALIGRDLATAQALITAVLAERGSEPRALASLVYTGPEAPGTRSRDPFEQVRELLASATRSIALYGLRVGQERGLLRTVSALMLGRGVQVRLVFDIAARAHAGAPFEAAPEPEQQVRELVARELRTQSGLALFVARSALRARVVVVDEERVLVTSAELDGREEDGFIDVGVLLSDRAYVRALGEEWTRLVALGAVAPVTL